MHQEKTKVPTHVAIMLDGNRRWSKKNNFILSRGYEHGADQVEKNMEAAFQSGVKYFTVWALSNDNLSKRSSGEIKILQKIFREKLQKLLTSNKIEKYRVHVRILGTGIAAFNDHELTVLKKEIEEKTKNFSNFYFTILLGYDGKTEMIEAIKTMRKTKEPVTFESVRKHLMTAPLPVVDLVIRTGGEPHWSGGFMMWHTGDSEFYFTKTLWPAFTPRELKKALRDFAMRRSLKGK